MEFARGRSLHSASSSPTPCWKRQRIEARGVSGADEGRRRRPRSHRSSTRSPGAGYWPRSASPDARARGRRGTGPQSAPSGGREGPDEADLASKIGSLLQEVEEYHRVRMRSRRSGEDTPPLDPPPARGRQDSHSLAIVEVRPRRPKPPPPPPPPERPVWVQAENLVMEALRRKDPLLPAGWPAVVAAAYEDETDALRWLLEARSNPNATTSTKASPLWHAVSRGNVSMVRLLLDARADPNHRKKNARGTWRTVLDMATAESASEAILDELIHSGAEHGEGKTPRQLALGPPPGLLALDDGPGRSGGGRRGAHGACKREPGVSREEMLAALAGLADEADGGAPLSVAPDAPGGDVGSPGTPPLGAPAGNSHPAASATTRGLPLRRAKQEVDELESHRSDEEAPVVKSGKVFAAQRAFRKSYSRALLPLEDDRLKLDFSKYSGSEQPRRLYARLSLPLLRGTDEEAERERARLVGFGTRPAPTAPAAPAPAPAAGAAPRAAPTQPAAPQHPPPPAELDDAQLADMLEDPWGCIMARAGPADAPADPGRARGSHASARAKQMPVSRAVGAAQPGDDAPGAAAACDVGPPVLSKSGGPMTRAAVTKAAPAVAAAWPPAPAGPPPQAAPAAKAAVLGGGAKPPPSRAPPEAGGALEAAGRRQPEAAPFGAPWSKPPPKMPPPPSGPPPPSAAPPPEFWKASSLAGPPSFAPPAVLPDLAASQEGEQEDGIGDLASLPTMAAEDIPPARGLDERTLNEQQTSIVRELALGCRLHDPSRDRFASREHARNTCLVNVSRLKFCHNTISPNFMNGNHRGKPVLSLLKDLHSGQADPRQIPALVVMQTSKGLEVVCGNRRLYCLKRYAAETSKSVDAWCMVYDWKAQDTPRPLVMKYILASTTQDGGSISLRSQ